MASASIETDAIFAKALRLLHSRSKDSADQLKMMLDEVLSQKSSKDVKFAENSIKKGKHGIETAVIKGPNDVKRDAEKRLLSSDRIKSESFESLQPPEKKRMIDISQTSRSSSSSPIPSSKSLSDDRISVKIEEDSDATDIEDESTDASEFAALFELACVICKQIDISPSNQLVECQECHKLYHQECHKPVVDQDVSDPRFVWYCAKCTKTMKKIVSKPTKGNNKSPVQTPTSASTVSPFKEFASQLSKTPIKGEPTLMPFKREPKVGMSQSTTPSSVSAASSTNKPIGLAALAASSRSTTVINAPPVNHKNKPPSGNNGNDASSSGTASGTSLLSSDKRSQNLKKSKSLKQSKY